MKLTSCLIAATALFATQAPALPANTFIYMHPSQQQQVLQAASEIIQGAFSRDKNALAPNIHTGGAFNKWCRHAKDGFLKSLDNGGANEWVIVAGNEAADTDSLVSSLATAYWLSHRTIDPVKAVALMQIKSAALDYRPENKLLMHDAKLQPAHEALLTLDQLKWPRYKLSQMIKGIVLTDHNRPLSYWQNVPLLGMIDHHDDRGRNATANPRIIKMIGSSTSLVTQLLLDEHSQHGLDIPKELADILFATISLDTNGLKKKKVSPEDTQAANGIFPYTSYGKGDIKKESKRIKKAMKKAQEDIADLNITQLYQRDYKGDIMYNSTKPVHIGYANVPYRLSELIEKTHNKTRQGWAGESRRFLRENQIDVLVILTKAKEDDGTKVREIILLVRHGQRLTEEEAERIYHKIRDSLEKSKALELKVWHDEKDFGHQRYAWKQQGDGQGRKAVRPIVETAAQEW